MYFLTQKLIYFTQICLCTFIQNELSIKSSIFYRLSELQKQLQKIKTIILSNINKMKIQSIFIIRIATDVVKKTKQNCLGVRNGAKCRVRLFTGIQAAIGARKRTKVATVVWETTQDYNHSFDCSRKVEHIPTMNVYH